MQRFSLFILFLIFSLTACKGPNPNEQIELLKEGEAISAESFKVLSGQLKKAMQRGGVQEAISYCNTAANPLIDSLEKKHSVHIKRVSFNYRNPENKPTSEEAIVLSKFESIHKEGQKPMAELARYDDRYTYYKPIQINTGVCLACHGHPGITIKEEDYGLIKTYYPDDHAIGYEEGDIRGMWAISFTGQ